MSLGNSLSVALGALFSFVFTASECWAGAGGMCMTGGIGVPEPASLSLLAVGVGAILVYRHRRNRRK